VEKISAHQSTDQTDSDADNNRANDSNVLLRVTGGLMIGLPDSEVILGTIESVTRHNLKHEILSSDEIKSRFPLLHALPSEIGN
jgi:sarcosine oxidase